MFPPKPVGVTAPITNPLFPTSAITDGVSFFSAFIPALITLAFVIGSIAFFAVLIMGAIQWTTAGSDKQGLEAAKSKVTNAIVGVILLFSTWAIIGFVEYFFCVNITLFEPNNLVLTSSAIGAPAPCPAQPASRGTGNAGVGGNGGPVAGQGVAACGCYTGGCAKLNQPGLGNDGLCWSCTSGGWSNNPRPAACPAITCVSSCK